MNIPNECTFETPFVDPGYVSERLLDARTSPTQAPRFVRDGQRDHWWLQGSALDSFDAVPSTVIDGFDNGLRS